MHLELAQVVGGIQPFRAVDRWLSARGCSKLPRPLSPPHPVTPQVPPCLCPSGHAVSFSRLASLWLSLLQQTGGNCFYWDSVRSLGPLGWSSYLNVNWLVTLITPIMLLRPEHNIIVPQGPRSWAILELCLPQLLVLKTFLWGKVRSRMRNIIQYWNG